MAQNLDINNDLCFDPYSDPRSPVVVTFDKITSARDRIKEYLVATPCYKSHVSALVNLDIYLKPDYLQYTGSFKERGVRNALMLLPEDKKKIGAMAVSVGNHGQAMSYHGKQLGIPITVVMPTTTPMMNIQKCRKFGANVIVEGQNLAAAKRSARIMAYKSGSSYINEYDHPDVIAGQGTLGLEVLEEVPDLEAIVIPVGGGSLISGTGMAIKTLKPSVQIIGVESVKTASFSNAMKHGKPVLTELGQTLADDLAIPKVGFNSFQTAHKLIDKMVTVTEEWIAIAILRLVELEKCVIEGAGACPLAALLSGQLKDLKAKKIVLVLTSGNINTSVLGRCLEHGLTADGRYIKFRVVISDRPGGILQLCELIASLQVCVKNILTERAWVTTDAFSVKVKCLCEVRDFDHALELHKLLEKNYTTIVFDLPSPTSSKLAIPLF